MNGTESIAKIWETACARAPHWASNTRFGDWAHSFPCHYSHGKVILVTNPDRSLSLRHLLSFMHRRENVFTDLAGRTQNPLGAPTAESTTRLLLQTREALRALGRAGRRPPTGSLGARFRPREGSQSSPASSGAIPVVDRLPALALPKYLLVGIRRSARCRASSVSPAHA